jgi:hypothetical protein
VYGATAYQTIVALLWYETYLIIRCFFFKSIMNVSVFLEFRLTQNTAYLLNIGVKWINLLSAFNNPRNGV